MKSRAFSLRSRSKAYVVSVAGAGLLGGGCGGGGGGSVAEIRSENLISDFEDMSAAIVANVGDPPRNGHWFAYNDDNPKGTDPGCMQVPLTDVERAPQPPAVYVGSAPPSIHAGGTGTKALHAQWSGCLVWGAGVGADLNDPTADAGTGNKKVAYDVTPYRGVTFWAMAGGASDASLRLKFPMVDETRISDGGDCDESMLGPGQCGDNFGEPFSLPKGATWKQYTIMWSDSTFAQVGWGVHFPWNPTHVTSIQIESVDKGPGYDFWIDDIYFIN